jgi:TorA maturation chaperone TorD
VDYSRLFIGPMKLVAPPYGSVYLEGGRRLMGDTTVDAVLIYRQAGLELDRDTHKDMPDHIAVELEFMYFLLLKETEGLRNGDNETATRYANIRKDFLKRHLGAWAFDFLKDMREGAHNDFYKNLALCTEAFLKEEIQWEFASQA